MKSNRSEGLARHFQGRRILVTGHTGFKGSWLVIWLRELGANVTGYALPPESNPALFCLAHLESACNHTLGDIRDLPRLATVFAEVKPEIVFHLAAQPLVRRSYREPKETFDVNVGGTVNVLEAIRRTSSVKAAVLITTDKVYENREWLHGYRETDPLGGHDPYSASKAAAELAILSYSRSFFHDGIGIAAARAGNVIGGGDWAEDRIIPDAVRATLAGHPLDVRSPNSLRPWQHVLEPLAGYLAIARKLEEDPVAFRGAYNLGPASHDITPVSSLVDRFMKELGQGCWRDASQQQNFAPHEAGLLRLACDRAHMLLGWRPLLETAQAVAMSAGWYRDVTWGDAKPQERCVCDIQFYEELARRHEQWWAL